MTTAPTIEFAAEPINLDWFRDARLLKPSRVETYAVVQDLWTIDPHVDDKRCYCYSCVEKRNSLDTSALKIMSHRQIRIDRFVGLMNKYGFRDYVDSYLLPTSLSRDLFRPPTTPSVPTSKYRVPTQITSNHMPPSGQTRFQFGVFSIRVKTERATDHAIATLKPLFNRNERSYNGPVMNVEYCPISCLPSYSDQSRLEIDPDLFKSKFAPSPLKRLPGERIRNDVFEPTASDIQRWKDGHTVDGVFKPKSYTDLKFNSRRPNWEFRSGADEVTFWSCQCRSLDVHF